MDNDEALWQEFVLSLGKQFVRAPDPDRTIVQCICGAHQMSLRNGLEDAQNRTSSAMEMFSAFKSLRSLPPLADDKMREFAEKVRELETQGHTERVSDADLSEEERGRLKAEFPDLFKDLI